MDSMFSSVGGTMRRDALDVGAVTASWRRVIPHEGSEVIFVQNDCELVPGAAVGGDLLSDGDGTLQEGQSRQHQQRGGCNTHY